MKYKKIIPIVISGGKGTRLFPISTEDCPKQFIEGIYSETLFEKSLNLVNNSDIFEEPIIITNEKYINVASKLIEKKFKSFKKGSFLAETEGKNTLPAIYLALKEVELKYGKDAICLTIFSDQLIENKINFENLIKDFQKNNTSLSNIILLGVKPSFVSTSYGYFKVNNNSIEEFKEKPNLKESEEYCKTENYFWNTGMCLISYSLLEQKLDLAKKEKLNETFLNSKSTIALTQFHCFTLKLFKTSSLDSESISRAIFEKDKALNYLELKSSWIDVGNFKSLKTSLENKDSFNNTIIGNKESVSLSNCKDNLIINKSNKPINIVGMSSVVIIETINGTLIGNLETIEELYKTK